MSFIERALRVMTHSDTRVAMTATTWDKSEARLALGPIVSVGGHKVTS